MLNVTIIFADASPLSFQCWDGFPEFLRRAEEVILQGRKDQGPHPLHRPVHHAYTFDTNTKALREYTPDDVIAYAAEARKMFAPAPKQAPAPAATGTPYERCTKCRTVEPDLTNGLCIDCFTKR